jgi:large subunit ribosomal protein L23
MRSKEYLTNVLVAPHVSEKTARATEKANQYVFRVRDEATKTEVRHAVELMFSVKVESVQVLNRPGKSRMFKQRRGRRNAIRKAYVRLAAGQTIDFTSTEK